MKLIQNIAILLMLSSSICMAQDKFEIAGTLTKVGNDKMVVLNYKNSAGKDAKDSALVKDGKFVFNGTTAFGNRSYLSLLPIVKDTAKPRQAADYQEFYLEKGKYQVMGTDSVKTAKIAGAQAQTDYLAYNSLMDTMLVHYKVLTDRYLKARSAKDEAAMKQVQVEGRPLGIRMNAAMDKFIFSHPDSYVTLDNIVANKMAVIDPTTFQPYYANLSKRLLASYTGQKVTERYNKAKQISLGKTFDFTLPDANGKSFSLSSLKGKYVLVDFWASWCAPCRAENPYMLAAYKALKDKNFEIVGISLDETKGAWLKAVAADAMPWLQVSDLKGFKNEVAMKYGITAIPQNVLINPEGIIVGKDLRGEDLTQKLAALIK